MKATMERNECRHLPHHDGRAGFTLLEMAIVLTIIGLMVGGVLTGTTLVAQAKLNKVMTDMQKYTTAVQAFQTKFNALPGDMMNATKYWGAVATPTNTTACYSVAGTGTQTCDGNGSGTIDCCYENYRAWQHLSLAGLIEGSYSGVSYSKTVGSVLCIAGQNCPKGPHGAGVYELGINGPSSAAGLAAQTPPFWSPVVSGIHTILYGTPAACGSGGCDSWAGYPTVTAPEALSLDNKYDDGMPFTGIITPFLGYSGSCTSPGLGSVNAGNYMSATYNISAGGPLCSIVYVTGF